MCYSSLHLQGIIRWAYCQWPFGHHSVSQDRQGMGGKHRLLGSCWSQLGLSARWFTGSILLVEQNLIFRGWQECPERNSKLLYLLSVHMYRQIHKYTFGKLIPAPSSRKLSNWLIIRVPVSLVLEIIPGQFRILEWLTLLEPVRNEENLNLLHRQYEQCHINTHTHTHTHTHIHTHTHTHTHILVTLITWSSLKMFILIYTYTYIPI